jgi:predicted alpha/beta superfamily hydrolase
MKLIALLLIVVMAGCSSLPKVEEVSSSPQFSRGDVSIEIDTILPESYQSSNHSYPVIYVLDGYWNKESIKEAYNALRFDNMIPEAIIVTIGYPAAIEDYETQRMWDLTPVYDAGFKAGGRSEDLLNILSGDLLPFIQNKYRTDKNRSILIGHSLAGLFTLYSLYERPNTFTHYAAISPSALWAEHALSKIDHNFAAHSNALNANLYITYETDEYRPYVAALEEYVELLKKRRYQDLSLAVAQVEGMGHVSMKAEGYMRGLAWSFTDIRPEGPSEFEKKNLRALELK